MEIKRFLFNIKRLFRRYICCIVYCLNFISKFVQLHFNLLLTILVRIYELRIYELRIYKLRIYFEKYSTICFKNIRPTD